MFSWQELIDIILPLIASAALGGVLGLERELKGQWAGLRTHIMVSLGATIFVLVGSKSTETTPSELSRIIQGVATGIGFIGAGTIIKLTKQMEIKGLTTASSIWLTAAVGTAVGLKMYMLAVCAVVLSLIVLRGLRTIEGYIIAAGRSTDDTINSPEGSHQKSSDTESVE